MLSIFAFGVESEHGFVVEISEVKFGLVSSFLKRLKIILNRLAGPIQNLNIPLNLSDFLMKFPKISINRLHLAIQVIPNLIQLIIQLPKPRHFFYFLLNLCLNINYCLSTFIVSAGVNGLVEVRLGLLFCNGFFL